MVHELINYGADVTAEDDAGYTPFNRACMMEHDEMAMFLLRQDVHLRRPDYFGWYPLHWACHSGLREVVGLLLSIDKSTLNETENISNQTPLHMAADNGWGNVVDILLDIHPDLAIRNAAEWTPLMTAIKEDHMTIAKKLIPKYEERQVNIADNEGKTPLMEACIKASLDIVKTLKHL